MDQPQPFEQFNIWYKTLLRPPPHNTWFTVRLDGVETRPAYIVAGNCITVRMKPSHDGLDVILIKPLPPEWRP